MDKNVIEKNYHMCIDSLLNLIVSIKKWHFIRKKKF